MQSAKKQQRRRVAAAASPPPYYDCLVGDHLDGSLLKLLPALVQLDPRAIYEPPPRAVADCHAWPGRCYMLTERGTRDWCSVGAP